MVCQQPCTCGDRGVTSADTFEGNPSATALPLPSFSSTTSAPTQRHPDLPKAWVTIRALLTLWGSALEAMHPSDAALLGES